MIKTYDNRGEKSLNDDMHLIPIAIKMPTNNTQTVSNLGNIEPPCEDD